MRQLLRLVATDDAALPAAADTPTLNRFPSSGV
jgi:hypothetical protein